MNTKISDLGPSDPASFQPGRGSQIAKNLDILGKQFPKQVDRVRELKRIYDHGETSLFSSQEFVYWLERGQIEFGIESHCAFVDKPVFLWWITLPKNILKLALEHCSYKPVRNALEKIIF